MYFIYVFADGYKTMTTAYTKAELEAEESVHGALKSASMTPGGVFPSDFFREGTDEVRELPETKPSEVGMEEAPKEEWSETDWPEGLPELSRATITALINVRESKNFWRKRDVKMTEALATAMRVKGVRRFHDGDVEIRLGASGRVWCGKYTKKKDAMQEGFFDGTF